MFDDCDTNARSLLDTALERARGRGHNWLGTEHLLLAFAERRDLLPPDVQELLPDPEALASALVAAGGHPRPEAELLKTVGVDLDLIRSAVRKTFGDDAVERLRRPVHQPWQPWRRPSRRCTSLLAGGPRVAPRLERSLEHARQAAERRQLPTVDPLALLFGTLEVEDAISNALLRDLGVDPDELRLAIDRHTG